MRVYLIRHGETEDAESRRYKGELDVPLSERGIEQMKRVSAFIGAEMQKSRSAEATPGLMSFRASALSAVYCSDLKRAVHSAEIIAEPFGLKPIILPELRERSFGEWEGMTFEEIEKKWPDAFRAWAENPLKHSPPGGESTIEVRERVIGALGKILNGIEARKLVSKRPVHFCTDIAIVAHGGVNRIILCELLGMPLENIFRIEQDYACLNIIEFHDGYAVIVLINGVG